MSLDERNWVLASGTTSWIGTLTLVEGANLIYARATDLAGNTETAVLAVTVEAPAFRVSSTLLIVTGVAVIGVGAAIAVILLRRRGG